MHRIDTRSLRWPIPALRAPAVGSWLEEATVADDPAPVVNPLYQGATFTIYDSPVGRALMLDEISNNDWT